MPKKSEILKRKVELVRKSVIILLEIVFFLINIFYPDKKYLFRLLFLLDLNDKIIYNILKQGKDELIWARCLILKKRS